MRYRADLARCAGDASSAAVELHGGFGKGFTPRIVDYDKNRPADPLFPFTAGRLGSGANMAFDATLVRELGGFDPATGAGTVARGGDDLSAFFRVIARGRGLAYQPDALVWHHHRRELAGVRAQAYGYGGRAGCVSGQRAGPRAGDVAGTGAPADRWIGLCLRQVLAAPRAPVRGLAQGVRRMAQGTNHAEALRG